MLETFREATRAMEDQDYDTLINFAVDLGLDPGVDPDVMIKKLQSRIKNSVKELSKIENSIAWERGS